MIINNDGADRRAKFGHHLIESANGTLAPQMSQRINSYNQVSPE
ncbi:hypothetical protein ACVR09_00945 [Streptococcus catagoni]